jgi:hypothetical protein
MESVRELGWVAVREAVVVAERMARKLVGLPLRTLRRLWHVRA